MPHSAKVQQLVVQVSGTRVARSAPTGSVAPVTGGLVSAAVLRAMLLAAESRVGMPDIWGANGPSAFDCSGLVRGSFAQGGVVIPRGAAEQARTGPGGPVRRPGPRALVVYADGPDPP